MTQIEAYVPVLLNFRDNSLVYSDDELKCLKRQVLGVENGIVESSTGATEFSHALSEDYLRESLGMVAAKPEWVDLVSRVEVYYYHHRIILKYVFRENLPFTEYRTARQLVVAHSRHVLISKFVAVINTAGPEHSGPLPNELGTVTTFYSYCIMLVPLREESQGRGRTGHPKDFRDDIENLLGSHTFRIVEVTPKLLERDRVHVVRISIPSVNLYSHGAVRTFLRVDVLNAIYQHMLYAKKEQDEKTEELRELKEFSIAELDTRNVMQEPQLHALWDHAVDALGGRMVDLQGVHQQTLLFRVSILAMLIALVGIVITLVFALA